MNVYVDDWRQPAQVGRLNARWSHLTADTPEELHEFAARLGLRRAWYQDHGHRWHYDVTDSKRRQAISRGAEPIGWRDIAALIAARRTSSLAAAARKPLSGQADLFGDMS